MNNSDILDYHVAQMTACDLTAPQYLALHPELRGEVRTMLLLTEQVRAVARPIPALSDAARQRIFARIQTCTPPPSPPPSTPAPPAAEPNPAHSGFFIPGFSRLEAARYIGAHGLEVLWRIHKAPSGCAAAIFDAVVLLMRALRRLEMYNSFR